MSMSSFIARLARDEDGGPLVEVAIILPILILFLFGGVDFMNALYQWNAAAKAAEIGARIAAVSDPIASGLTSIRGQCAEFRRGVGKPDARFHRLLRRRRGGLRLHERRVRRHGLVFGGCDGAHRLWASREWRLARLPPPNISPGCATSHPPIAPQYVTVVYKQTGLGYAGRSPGPVPTITVSLNAASSKTKLPFKFFFLPFASINIPQVTTTITGEALSASAAN